MSDFEEYLKKHKQDLELSEVNPKIWEGISTEMKSIKRKTYPLYRVLIGFAASMLVVFLAMEFQGNNDKISFSDELLAEYGFEKSEINKSFENKLGMIKTSAVPVDYKSDLELILTQVKYLDQRHLEAINYLKEQDYHESLAKEVLDYYKKKSEILDRVIMEINKINQKDKKYEINSPTAFIEM